MRNFIAIAGFSLAFAFSILTPSIAAAAAVEARIDISEQKMRIYSNGRLKHVWKISSGRGKYHTPRGSYRPVRMHQMWYSRKYNMAPMPHSIFFYGGYAIHGTPHIKNLGRPASHGCVRLHPNHARTLFKLAQRVGPGNVRIKITN